MQLLTGNDLGLYYGDHEVFSDVTIEVTDRARIGIVGPNGGGKTSLLRVLIGELEPNAGATQRMRGLRIGYVPQSPGNVVGSSLRDEITTAFAELRDLERELESSAGWAEHGEPQERRKEERRYAALLERYDALGSHDYRSVVERISTGVGLTAAVLDAPAASASGGERTRAALAKALCSDPDLLILDEPTNYLDFQALEWLEGMLNRRRHALVVVSHDRQFLDQVVTRVWEVERRRLQSFPGNYTKYRSLKTELLQRQEKEYDSQQAYIAKEESFIQRYRAGQRSREARGRATRLQRLKRVEATTTEPSVAFSMPQASRTGGVVFGARGLTVGFSADGSTTHLLTVPDIELERGSRTAVVGRNGSGKTTLLDTLLGLRPPLTGTASTGHNVEVGYLSQDLADLPEDMSVLEALLDAKNMPPGDARSYLARFLFRGEDVMDVVSTLSGGERVRLALARLLIVEPNVLVMDEPTTHLDIPSREALERVLLTYGGTMLFVSHDRRFISLLADRLWVLESGTVHQFEGSFEEWLRATSKIPAPGQPTRGARPPKAKPPKARQEPRVKTEALERTIMDLEARVGDLERQLGEASERQDVAEVARLGREYDEVKANLDRTWAGWTG